MSAQHPTNHLPSSGAESRGRWPAVKALIRTPAFDGAIECERQGAFRGAFALAIVSVGAFAFAYVTLSEGIHAQGVEWTRLFLGGASALVGLVFTVGTVNGLRRRIPWSHTDLIAVKSGSERVVWHFVRLRGPRCWYVVGFDDGRLLKVLVDERPVLRAIGAELCTLHPAPDIGIGYSEEKATAFADRYVRKG